jgi:tetratricopeptide (TPR) repeat protein
MHVFQGKRTEYRADLDDMQRLADALDDDRLRAEVARNRSGYSMVTGDYPSMERHARQVMSLGEFLGDQSVTLRGQRQLAMALLRQGDREAATALASEGLARARSLSLRAVESSMLNALSIALSQSGGHLIEILELDLQQLAICKAIGDRRGESTTLNNIGCSWLALGEHREAGRHFESALQLIRGLGYRLAESDPLHGLGRLALWRGDASVALACVESALDIAVEVEDRHQELIASLLLGQALAALGRHAEARRAYDRAHALAIDGENHFRHDALAGLADVALELGDVAGALRELESVLGHLDGGGTLEGAEQPRLIELVVYRVLARAGDPRANRVLAGAYAALQAASDGISNAGLRRGFIDNIPEHRDIVEAWNELQRSAPPAR